MTIRFKVLSLRFSIRPSLLQPPSSSSATLDLRQVHQLASMATFDFDRDFGRIDIHTHILPKEWPDWNKRFGYEGWLTMEHDAHGTARMLNSDGSIFRVVEENCWSATKRIEEMDEKKVSVQVTSLRGS